MLTVQSCDHIILNMPPFEFASKKIASLGFLLMAIGFVTLLSIAIFAKSIPASVLLKRVLPAGSACLSVALILFSSLTFYENAKRKTHHFLEYLSGRGGLSSSYGEALLASAMLLIAGVTIGVFSLLFALK